MNANQPTSFLHDVDIHACQCKHRITATFVEVCALCGCYWLTLQCYMLCAFIRKMFCAVITKTWTVIVLSLVYRAHRITTFRLYKWPLISSLMTIERLYTGRFFSSPFGIWCRFLKYHDIGSVFSVFHLVSRYILNFASESVYGFWRKIRIRIASSFRPCMLMSDILRPNNNWNRMVLRDSGPTYLATQHERVASMAFFVLCVCVCVCVWYLCLKTRSLHRNCNDS